MPSRQQDEPIKRTHTPSTGKSAAPTSGPGDKAGNAAAVEALTYSAPVGQELPPVLEVVGSGRAPKGKAQR